MANCAAFPRRSPDLCPCCNRPLPPALTVSGPLRNRVLELVARRPNGISMMELVGIVYMGCREPPWAVGSVKSTVFQMNKELKPQGYMIRARHGPGARYRLLRVEAT